MEEGSQNKYLFPSCICPKKKVDAHTPPMTMMMTYVCEYNYISVLVVALSKSQV